MTKCRWLGLGWVILILALSGCTTSYRIQVVDGLPREVYLNYSKGADVKVGDLFVLYEDHRQQSSSTPQGHGGHGGQGGETQTVMKHEKAVVQVIRIIDELQASVKVLSGEVQDGLEAKRLK